jgi:predicted nucleic acid-binding protein
MKNVFLDTNILIDYYGNRPGAFEAEQILRAANAGEITVYASLLTFANLAYVIRHNHTRAEVYDALDKFERLVNTLPMDRNQLRAAINYPCKDFEDMLQYQCAVAGGCDVIITNNKKDFVEYCKLPLYTAAEYINSL